MVFEIDYCITHFDTDVLDCHELVGDIITRPSVRDYKSAQDVSSALFLMQRVVPRP